jgi:methionyl-tRNA formyltransferase
LESEISVKIFKAQIEAVSHQNQPGEILTDNKKHLKIACTDGFLHILDLQIAGKKRMGIAEFLRGFPNAGSYSAQ